ncbi:xylose isomerase-like protein [Mycena capillaripes]|nr:xylose isomerase-like protein [Mycena capillaripes]
MVPKFAIASLSLGNCAHHQLPTKIRTAASLGYEGIEIFIPDFEAFVGEVKEGLHRDLFPDEEQPPQDSVEVDCAKAIARLCDSLNIAIPVLQPLRDFENFASPHALGGGGLPAALEEAERWLKLMPHFNTRLLLVCSNYIEPEDHPFAPFDPTKQPPPSFSTAPGTRTKQLSAYLDAQVEAFRALGRVAARYGVRIGYEALAWGTVVDNWEQVWDVVRRVGRENVGIILDSFNFLGNQYADPSNATHSALLQNLVVLARTIPAHKIFLYQLADAEPPCASSATTESTPCAPPRMAWSRAARLFPCEDALGAWLPVTDLSLAVVEAGYPAATHDTCGDEDDVWWSLEVFSNSLMDPRPECVEEHGGRGLVGLKTLWERVCVGIEEARDRVASSPTPSDESRSSGDNGSERAVLSDSDTSEEGISSLSGTAVNECQPAGRMAGTKWSDSCIVG